MLTINWAELTSPPGGRRRVKVNSKSLTVSKQKSAAKQTRDIRRNDGETERRRDGETERRRDGETELPINAPSLRLSVSLSLHLSVVLHSDNWRPACGDSIHGRHGAIRH